MEDLLKNTFNGDLKEKLVTLTNEYKLSKEQLITIEALLVSYLIMARNNKNINNIIVEIIPTVLNSQSPFNNCINIIVDYLLKNELTSKDLIDNYVVNGYCFHSFNNAFYNTINTNGLVIEQKPWDNDKIDEIRLLFKEKGINNIFGLYQGKKNTPLFFAKSLNSSSFYSYSSPTWFRHFASGGMSANPALFDKDAFYNRNYDSCLNNILNACSNFNIIEKNKVIDFFNQYWKKLGNNEMPSIALIKRNKITNYNIPTKLDNEPDNLYVKRIITSNCSGNIMVNNNIKKEDLIVFSYDIENKKERGNIR